MNRLALAVTGALAWMAWPALPVWAQSGAASPPSSTTRPGAAAGSPQIQAIQQAADPSALVAAYAAAYAANQNDSRSLQAYVAKMVDFGMPEMAFHQAESLAARDAHSGLARGVLAYVDAKRGQMTEALSQGADAASLSPDLPFVQRTVGELLAWYDRNFLTAGVPDAMKVRLDATRTLLGGKPAFAQSYEDARKALADEASAGEAGAVATPPSAMARQAENGAAETQPAEPMIYGAGSTVYTTPPPEEPIYQPIYYYPAYYDYPTYGGGWDWWWPSGVFLGSVFDPFPDVVVIGGHHHRHGRDWDRDRDGAWWRDRGGSFRAGERPIFDRRGVTAAAGERGRIFTPSNGRTSAAANAREFGRRGAGSEVARNGGLNNHIFATPSQGVNNHVFATPGTPHGGRVAAPRGAVSTPRALSGGPMFSRSVPRTFSPAAGAPRTFSAPSGGGFSRSYAAPSGGARSYAAPSGGGGRSFGGGGGRGRR
jgi:hypothetical protein